MNNGREVASVPPGRLKAAVARALYLVGWYFGTARAHWRAWVCRRRGHRSGVGYRYGTLSRGRPITDHLSRTVQYRPGCVRCRESLGPWQTVTTEKIPSWDPQAKAVKGNWKAWEKLARGEVIWTFYSEIQEQKTAGTMANQGGK